ncbi:MAG: HNH endonuclease [Krumholzibacteria bacterium]|nr:HNH endonuclease [Candidatus Krumholzibacteria bacterium]
MHGFIATTDQDWFDFLAARADLDEVNFWAPSGKATLKSIPPGSPFLFKLKSPHHAIGGFGFLGPVSSVPMSLAWEAFGEKNGAPDLPTMARRIRKYRGRFEMPKGGAGFDPPVGCRMILQPMFFKRDDWIPAPRDWARNIVQGKTYDLRQGEGKRIWDACVERLTARRGELPLPAARDKVAAGPRYGREQVYRPRLGQGSFRIAVTDAYGRACAVTGEHSLPVLDSAHIQPYADGGPHEVSNGLLLRADLHRLYDKGYVTVTPDYEFRVSGALRDEFENGRVYYDLESMVRERGTIYLPTGVEHRPDQDRLAWHREVVYRG